MKVKALQLGKAMSAALFVLLLSVAGMKNALAQNLVATLQHGDNISMYYGTNAFVQAHEAAQTGDIITLSSGIFNPTTITKAITLRGAGCCMDTVTGIYPTIFADDITADVPDEENSLTIEGIYFQDYFYYGILNNPKFIKCNITDIDDTDNALMQYAQFVDCMIKDSWWSSSSASTLSHIQFMNCYVRINPTFCTNETDVSFVNSIVCFADGVVEKVLAVNSIFYYYRTTGWTSGQGLNNMNPASSSCLFYNCVAIKKDNTGSDFFVNQTNTTNIMSYISDVFETYDGYYSSNSSFDLFNERFILKSSFASSFLGNDGTEVGIYGGLAPYNPRPNYMVLKQCNVATQSTDDNKLNVEIQVVSEGE